MGEEFGHSTVARAGARIDLGEILGDKSRNGRGGRWASCGYRFDLKQESVDATDDNRFSNGQIRGRDGIPEFAVHEYFSARRERGLGDANFADQALRPGDNFIPSSLESDAHQECGDEAERNAYRKRGEQVNPHFRDWRIDQQQSPKSKQRDAADGEHAVASEFRFSGEERKRAENEHQRGEARGKKIQRKGGDQNKDDAHGSG